MVIALFLATEYQPQSNVSVESRLNSLKAHRGGAKEVPDQVGSKYFSYFG